MKIFLPLALVTLLFQQGDYTEPVAAELIEMFGQPLLIDKDEFTYSSPTVRSYDLTKQGMRAYMTSAEIQAYRQGQLNTEPVELVIRRELGIDAVPFGDVVDTAADGNYKRIKYATGAVLEYLIGTPDQPNGEYMVVLHGCSATPDNLFGLTGPNYTNEAALVAMEHGYTVLSPHLMAQCDLLDDLTALGQMTSGTTSMGYSIMLVQAMLAEEIPGQEYSFYGISYGAQVGMYLAAIDENMQTLISSGNMIIDYYKAIANRLDNLSHANRRTGTALSLRRHLTIDHILQRFLECDKQLIVEMGGYDWPKNIAPLLRLRGWCNERENCNLDIVLFRGYHEMAPNLSIPKIEE